MSSENPHCNFTRMYPEVTNNIFCKNECNITRASNLEEVWLKCIVICILVGLFMF